MKGQDTDQPYRALYDRGVQILTGAGVAEASLDARLLLEHVCGTTHETLLAHGDRAVTKEEAEAYEALIAKRAQRVPLAYLTGVQEFMGLTFQVTPDVLIPNPDTEVLVEAALKVTKGNLTRGQVHLSDSSVQHDLHPVKSDSVPDPLSDYGVPEPVEGPHGGIRILDLCTGSGCVGLSLLSHTKDTTLVATDISEAALAVAKENARRLKLSERAAFVCCDLWPAVLTGGQVHLSDSSVQHDLYPVKSDSVPDPLSERFDLIVSNPPYVRTDVIDTLEPEVREHEPRLALDGGADGLIFYRRILEGVPAYLKEGGILLVEIGFDSGADVKALLEAAGLQDVRVIKDLAGLDRVVEGRV